ncbi:hypothetical protein BJX64DRAFT_285515 [Aspergillus heterothallicus]
MPFPITAGNIRSNGANSHEEVAGSKHAYASKFNRALFRALDALPQDPVGVGFSHLGMDGAWRNHDGNGKVVSYRALSPGEIAEVLGDVSGSNARESCEGPGEGVDGRAVTDFEQLVNPPPSPKGLALLPPASIPNFSMASKVGSTTKPQSEVVELQVGDRRFTALRSTLVLENTYFASLLSGRWKTSAREDGSYFIDADPDLFVHILRYLRRGLYPIFYDVHKGHGSRSTMH